MNLISLFDTDFEEWNVVTCAFTYMLYLYKSKMIILVDDMSQVGVAPLYPL